MDITISSRALAYVRERATGFMQSQCRIERVAKASFNQTTGRAVGGAKVVVYQGRCRIREMSAGGIVLVGEDDVFMQSTMISLPWDIPVLPKRDDEITITAHNTDPMMIGKRFVIDSSAKAGELRATRSFSIRGYQER